MGLIARLFNCRDSSLKHVTEVASITNGPGTYSTDIVGESYYQKALERICGGWSKNGHRREVEAFLHVESNRSRYPNAIRVVVKGETVGYLDRETARCYRTQLEKAGLRGTTVKCNAIIVGGWDRGNLDIGHFGVKLDLPGD